MQEITRNIFLLLIVAAVMFIGYIMKLINEKL